VETFDEETDRSHVRRTLKILTSVAGEPFRQRPSSTPVSGQRVALRVAAPRGATVRWYLIFADLSRNYANANPPWEPGAYQWTGFDPIAYHRIELTCFRDARTIVPFAGGDIMAPVRDWFRARGAGDRADLFYSGDVGTFWFQVEVEQEGVVRRSWGIEDAGERGLSPKTTRISIRGGEGYLGWVSSYFNVPGVFGSVLSQSAHHIGADCADVLMSAWAKWRNRSLKKNYNVQMMLSRFPRVAEVHVESGAPDTPLRWGDDVRPGDAIAVRYGDAGRKFHHVGALYEDANANGVLDGEDLALHAGPDPLHFTRMKHGAFDGHVIILRP
jgi:hypothetical protein